MNPFKQGVGSRGGQEGKIVKQSLFIDCTNLVRILKERLYLRCKRDPSVMNAVVERLDTDTVTNEPKPAHLRIPQRDGKHTTKFLQTRNAPFLKSMQDHLGVGVIRFPAAPPQRFE